MTAKQRRIFMSESKRVLNNQCVFKKKLFNDARFEFRNVELSLRDHASGMF